MAILKRMVYVSLAFVQFVWRSVYCNGPLPSDFYHPGPGVYFESWITSANYYPNYLKMPNYPSCPTFVSNRDSFTYATVYRYQKQHGRYRAIFISKMNGKHRFFALVNNKASLYIELNPMGMKKILDVGTPQGNDWSQRQWSDEVDLMRGFRYELTVYHYGNGYGADFFHLGVEFPDKTEEKPISKNYLWRSMEFYKWTGLIAHKYDGFNYPAGMDEENQSQYSLEKVYSMNPNYPNKTSAYQCKPTLYDELGHHYDYYALRYIGYVKPTVNASYKYRMHCNELCEFFLAQNGTEISLGTYNDNWETSRGIAWTEMDAGNLSSLAWYPIKVFFTESWGNDYLQIMHQYSSGNFSTSWNGMLRNLLPEETAKSVLLPTLKVINSTAVSARFSSVPFLPPRDLWSYIQRHEVLYHRKEFDNDPVQKIAINATLPQVAVATGLKKYTEYLFYAHYYGSIKGQDHNIITRYSLPVRTDEDVPETAPPFVKTKKQSSTTIRILWNTLSEFSHWNGIGLGFEVQYKLKSLGTSNWTSRLTVGIGNRQYYANGLLKYRVYEFRVAARTSKGSGPFSSIVEERTKEDIPSGGPTDLSAHNTSSTSINVTWNEIPFEHQNGIIIGYRLYIRRAGSRGNWLIHDINKQYFSQAGLSIWTSYEVKVSGKTSVGEGNSSDIVNATTDEDVPGAPPVSVTATSRTANLINITWLEIEESKRNGIIQSYIIKYKRTDGKGVLVDLTVYGEYALLQNLAAYTEYEVQVAGVTSKGHGVFSPTAVFKTLESGPDAPPMNLVGNYVNSTAIEIKWGPVPEEDRNGIIQRYLVRYRAKGSLIGWKEITVGYTTSALCIGSLQHYTVYEVKILAETSVSRGPFCNVTEIRTDAGAPTLPPMHLSGHFVNHTSIEMNWTRVPKGARHGIIVGYILNYRDETIKNAIWRSIVVPNSQNGSDVFSQIVTGLKIYTPYSFKIQAFTYRGNGVFSTVVTVWTDEHEPEEIPRKVSGLNASSTEIILEWENMKEAHGEANGKVLGYTINYRVADCHEDKPAGCDESHIFSITSNGSLSEIKIQGLRKYTIYSLSVQVFNIKGKGNFSKEINVTTGEDKPDMPPTLVETWPSQSDSIKVYWSPIPESHRNGIILGYRVFYKAIDEPQRRYDRAPRSLNALAIYGALSGEKMVEVNSSANSVEIKDLKDFSWYQVRIGAFTSKGLGITFKINGTAKQEGPIEAPKLKVVDMSGITEILLNWEAISSPGARGEVLGYRVQYWLSEMQEIPVVQAQKHNVFVFAPNRTTTLTGLQQFARYRIRIQAFTEGGFGVWSPEQNGDTCRCSKTLSSAKMLFPPLVNEHNMEVIPTMLNKAITACCGNCSGKHGVSSINWKRDSLNYSSLKYSKKELLEATAAGTSLVLPIYMTSYEMKGDGDKNQYVVVPLVSSKNLAIFARKLNDRELGSIAASTVVTSLMGQYPLLLISAILTILAGILFWIFERKDNKEEFAQKYFRGTGSGVWLAFITMTTVGYGDVAPKTSLGKLHGVIWMIIGLILTTMVVGNISSILSIEFVFQPRSFASKDRVLVSNDDFMLAVHLFGSKVFIGNTSDGKYVQESLLSGNATKVVMNIYTAGLLKDHLIHPNIILETVERVDASFGVALAGETMRIRHCLNRFARENSELVHVKIKESTYMYEIERQNSVEILKHVGSPSSDIMQNLTFYGCIMLAFLVPFGIVWDLRRCMRGRAKVKTDVQIRQELSVDVIEAIEKLESSIISIFNEAECRHTSERIALSKMKHGRYMALASIYPGLHAFDPDMPKPSTETLGRDVMERKEEPTQKVDDDNEDEDDLDKPIYYKPDSF